MSLTAVRVILNIGEATFPRATADSFEPGQLTVTYVDDETIAEVYEPYQWRSASVLLNGLQEFGFKNKYFVERAHMREHVSPARRSA